MFAEWSVSLPESTTNCFEFPGSFWYGRLARHHCRRFYRCPCARRSSRHRQLCLRTRESSSWPLYRIRHPVSLGTLCADCRGGSSRGGYSCAAGRSHHTNTGSLLCGEAYRRGRWRHDYLQPQPLPMERSEVQSKLRRVRQPRHHQRG